MAMVLVTTTPAGSSYVYAPLKGARSYSLTSPDAPGVFLRIWITGGTLASDQGVDSRAGEGTVFLFGGCDPVDNQTCNYSATSGGQGTINSNVGTDPDKVTGSGTLEQTTFRVT